MTVLSPEALARAASHYLARYAASEARLREVLTRKVLRAHAKRDLPPPDPNEVEDLVTGVVARLTRAGLVDDMAYGRGRAAGLARKGWPAWRIALSLRQEAIDPDAPALAEATALDETAQARRYAERKRLGPFRPGARAEHRQADIARLARAGFPVAVARAVVEGEAGEA